MRRPKKPSTNAICNSSVGTFFRLRFGALQHFRLYAIIFHFKRYFERRLEKKKWKLFNMQAMRRRHNCTSRVLANSTRNAQIRCAKRHPTRSCIAAHTKMCNSTRHNIHLHWPKHSVRRNFFPFLPFWGALHAFCCGKKIVVCWTECVHFMRMHACEYGLWLFRDAHSRKIKRRTSAHEIWQTMRGGSSCVGGESNRYMYRYSNSRLQEMNIHSISSAIRGVR